VAADLLESVADFLHRLAGAPPPAQVADDMVGCFGDTLGTRMAAILTARPPLLIVFALSGYEPDQVADFESLPLDGDYPATRAFHEAEVAIDAMADLSSEYGAMAAPTSRGRRLMKRHPDGYSVAAPIVGGGRTLGAYTLVGQSGREWGTLELAALSTISHALGMWLTHPDSGLPDEYTAVSPALTPRQVEVLARLAAGFTNAAIAVDLHCSESTVKAEIGRILRSLDVDTREAAAERALATGLIDGSPA